MPATQQHPLTVVAPLRDGLGPLDAVSASMKALRDPVIERLRGVKTLHFGRFVLLPDEPGGPPTRLAFESNHDGERAPHVKELAEALAPFEDALCLWKDYRKGRVADLVEKRALPAPTFYLGHPGLTVEQIHADDEVRDRLAGLLDEMDGADRLDGKSAYQIREELLAKLADDGKPRTLGFVDRGLPVQPFAERRMHLVIAGTVLAAVGVVPVTAVQEIFERIEESKPGNEPRLIGEGDPRLDPIIDHEDRVTQNGLTHFVPLRPGKWRKATMRFVLWFLEQARQKIAYQGTLGGISSIHFARWVILDDDRVLFFSNYDGSWEAYLGDFVDKAHLYLSAVWSNTKWFPKTYGLVLEGASKESTFKQWVRTFQVENQIWYSAYPKLTVQNVLDNARVREGAVGVMTEDEAQAWLRLF